MKLAFFLATPPAPRPELDAAVQEIESLRRVFGGTLTPLYPADSYRPWIRRRRLRREQVERWLALDREVDLHHVVSDRALDYAVLTRLRRPVVFRLLTPDGNLVALTRIGRHGPIVVSAPGEAERLRRSGLPDVEAIPPGIDLSRFRETPLPPEAPFTVLCGSAPWTRRQFATKGLDALLEALRRRPDMRLVLLWRGVLRRQVERRLRAAGIEERTELIDETIEPREVLARAHVAVLTPSSRRVVKAFPHSLLEALAAGRPIITSDRLAIADWVSAGRCGVVVEPTAEAIGAALDRVHSEYASYQRAAAELDMSAFSTTACVAAYRALYERVARGREGG